ncbi:MAG: sigma-54 dependent transcriptional regulator [Tannerellaceae bacterium]|jgi:DNA-binding NtrC family response regulator|nr:sigma-54 dependent transcriptional regulator [Tannerellaceae bacterium]
MKAKIVIADNEAPIRKVMTLLLREEGYEVMAVANGREALNALPAFRPDVALLDRQMPLMGGVETFEAIRKRFPGPAVIFITAYGSIPLAVDTVKKGAYDFIEKPFDNDDLLLKVKRAAEISRATGKAGTPQERSQPGTHPVIGESNGLRQVIDRAKRVAATGATVLICGESGTGKELIAHIIHRNSRRAAAPFVAVNCGAIPLTLMESELFDHEKDAFTDAKETQPGTFERASGGTLFLDEIGELPIEAQVKLLRVLEEKRITRIGGKASLPVDVRIVAATNRNLEEEVRKGTFRLDLLYRLNVFTLTIPPLRERREDIPPLVDFFIARHNEALGLSISGVSREAMEMIASYGWPGNVRDLDNAIQSAMILAPFGAIQTEHLPPRVKGGKQAGSPSIPQGEAGSIKEANAQAEKDLILETLKKYNYNRILTAGALNVSRKTLFNKMKRYFKK